MNFREYQRLANKTAQYPMDIRLLGDNSIVKLKWVYPALGLSAETGELLNKLKKVVRDQNGIVATGEEEFESGSHITIDDVGKEIGDVLWYVAALCTELGLSLDKVAAYNIEKLKARAKNNKIKGSGDDR